MPENQTKNFAIASATLNHLRYTITDDMHHLISHPLLSKLIKDDLKQ